MFDTVTDDLHRETLAASMRAKTAPDSRIADILTRRDRVEKRLELREE